MKTVGIVFANTNNPVAMDFVKSSLEEVFGDFVQFKLYFTDQFQPDTFLDDDAFLMSSEVPFDHLKQYVNSCAAIYELERSLPKQALSEVLMLPAGTDVLVVNDGFEAAREVITNFASLDVKHLNMVPYDYKKKDTGIYRDFQVAITPGEPQNVPPHIHKIIDIGYRKISFGTMYMLMLFLDLDLEIVNRNLFRYIQTLVEPNSTFHDNYIFNYLKGQMLNHLASQSDQSIILLDSQLRPIFANKKALTMFHVSQVRHIDIGHFLDWTIFDARQNTSTVVTIDERSYSCDKYTFSITGEPIGHFLLLQPESEVETAIRQNKKNGYIAKYHFSDIIHVSSKMDELITKMFRISPTDLTVLISGESGTGKELAAQSIHNASFRNKAPFVAINCAALPENLLESELFGYESGAFTGAKDKGKIGLFEQANHGTIFLDEIGDISPKLQTELLRVIQEKQIMRLGSDHLIDIDVRLITATNKDLSEAVRNGEFRQDLYFRLNVLPFQLPPLRERREDIPLLLEYFMGASFRCLSETEHRILQAYDWPGNIRELENVSTYYAALSSLPDYLIRSVESASVPENPASLETLVLQLIAAGSSPSHGIGRSALLQSLRDHSMHVSDSHLRKVLSSLKEQGWVVIEKGRGGTRITEEGKAAATKVI